MTSVTSMTSAADLWVFFLDDFRKCLNVFMGSVQRVPKVQGFIDIKTLHLVDKCCNDTDEETANVVIYF